MNYIQRCIVIPTSCVKLAREMCVALAGPAGDGMFTTALSPTGAAPATHYVSAGMIEQRFADLLTPEAAEDILASAESVGLTVSLDALVGLLSSMDVSDSDPWGVFARLGLSLVREEAPVESP